MKNLSLVPASILLALSAVYAADATLPPGIDPIVTSMPATAAQGWQLENPATSHAELWNPKWVAQNPPTKFEECDVLVISTGLGGVFSADELLAQIPGLNIRIVDQNPYTGGNSTGQDWNGVSAETGASFINKPEKGDEVDQLLKRVGADKDMIFHTPADNPVMVKGADGKWTRVADIWSTGSSAANKAQFNAIRAYYTKMGTPAGTPYPNIPFSNDKEKSDLIAQDQTTARANFEKVVGGTLDPVLDAALDHWVWSDNSVTINEASPSTVDNFLGVNFGGIVSFPGGNSFVVKKIFEYWQSKGVDLASRISTSTLARNVQIVQDGVLVTTVDDKGVVTQIKAKAVVHGGAKFIVGATVQDLEKERLAAFAKMKWRGFVTANVKVKLKNPIPKEKQFYDMYLLDPDVVKAGTAQAQSNMQGATDVIGSFSDTAAIFTFFWPIPYDGARGMLLNPVSLATFKAKILDQYHNILSPELGLQDAEIVEVDMQRRGHPMTATLKGNYAEDIPSVIRKPSKGKFETDRVYYVNQDNWLLPAFETILAEAKTQMAALVKMLAGQGVGGAAAKSQAVKTTVATAATCKKVFKSK